MTAKIAQTWKWIYPWWPHRRSSASNPISKPCSSLSVTCHPRLCFALASETTRIYRCWIWRWMKQGKSWPFAQRLLDSWWSWTFWRSVGQVPCIMSDCRRFSTLLLGSHTILSCKVNCRCRCCWFSSHSLRNFWLIAFRTILPFRIIVRIDKWRLASLLRDRACLSWFY